MLFFLLINVKMPTIVGIFTFMTRKKSRSAELSMNFFYNFGASLIMIISRSPIRAVAAIDCSSLLLVLLSKFFVIASKAWVLHLSDRFYCRYSRTSTARTLLEP